MVSFTAHATRGVIRNPTWRRWTMCALLGLALLLILSGTTVLASALDPREHLGWALFFWIACAWLTVTALFLALFDLIMIRVAAREARRNLRHTYSDD